MIAYGYEGFGVSGITDPIVGKYYERVNIIFLFFKNFYIYDGCEFLLNNGKHRYLCVGLVCTKENRFTEVITIDNKTKKSIALQLKQIKEVSYPPEVAEDREREREKEREKFF